MLEDFKYEVFLNHNAKDKAWVRRLAERLRATAVRVWFNESLINPGDNVGLAVGRGLEAARTLALCLSPAALRSDWVGLERRTVLFCDPSNASRRFIRLRLGKTKIESALEGHPTNSRFS